MITNKYLLLVLLFITDILASFWMYLMYRDINNRTAGLLRTKKQQKVLETGFIFVDSIIWSVMWSMFLVFYTGGPYIEILSPLLILNILVRLVFDIALVKKNEVILSIAMSSYFVQTFLSWFVITS